MICFEQNVFKTKNKTNSLGLYFKFIFIFLFLILLWSSPVSVFAGGFGGGGSSGSGGTVGDGDNIIENIDEQRINQYCSFVSWPSGCPDARVRIGSDGLTLNEISSLGINTNEYSKWGIKENIANLKDNYFVLDLPDEKAIKVEVVEKADGSTELKSYAALVDPKTGGRTNTKLASETVQEFQGYYYYDIKTTTWDEDLEYENKDKITYTRRVYFKYVELKKEERGITKIKNKAKQRFNLQNIKKTV